MRLRAYSDQILTYFDELCVFRGVFWCILQDVSRLRILKYFACIRSAYIDVSIIENTELRDCVLITAYFTVFRRYSHNTCRLGTRDNITTRYQ